nr:unnamed protein product [Callosobruchus chinensis]
MDLLERMKRNILSELNGYRTNQSGSSHDKGEAENRQLIVRLKRMDYEVNQKNVPGHLPDLQTNHLEVHVGSCSETQCESSDEDVVQLDTNDPLFQENEDADRLLIQTIPSTLETRIKAEGEVEEVDVESHDVDQLENSRCTYLQIDTGRNLENPTAIYFSPATNMFDNQPESIENQSEVLLHIPSPGGNRQLDANSWNPEIEMNNFVMYAIRNNETIRADLIFERENFISLERAFLEIVHDHMERKNFAQKLMSKARYWNLIRMIKKSKAKPLLSSNDRRVLKNYDVLNVGESEKLIVPIKDPADPIIFYVHIEEMYHILIEVYLRFIHIRKQLMYVELKKKYKNFTKEVIAIFLDLCNSCTTRPSGVQPTPSDNREQLLNASRVQEHIIEDIPEIVAVENYNEMETRFNERINQIANRMAGSIYFMTRSTYYKLLQTVRNVDSSRSNRLLLRRFAVETSNGTEILIAINRLHPIQGMHLEYLHIEELFAVIHKVHIRMKHAAKDVMYPLLGNKYMNVAMIAVEEYIGLCQVCQRTETSQREARRSRYLESDELVWDLYTMDKTPHSTLSIPEMNLLFNLRLRELVDFSPCDLLTKQDYSLLVEEVKTAQRKTSKDLRDHHLSCLYDVIKYMDQEILTTSSENTRYQSKVYIHFEQAFHIIHDCHILSGHSGNDIMMAKLAEKFQNITTSMVTLYMEVCGFCLKKHAAYNNILMTRLFGREDCTPTDPHEHERRNSLSGRGEKCLQETDDAVDEAIVLEISGDSIERTDIIDTSKNRFETEDTTSDYQFSFQSREEFGSESVEIETERYDQAAVFEDEGSDVVEVDAKFETKYHQPSDPDRTPEVDKANEAQEMNLDHHANKKNNVDLIETDSANESISAPRKNVDGIIEQASNIPIAEIGETCEGIEVSLGRQESLGKVKEGSMEQMIETNGTNQRRLFLAKDVVTPHTVNVVETPAIAEENEERISNRDEMFTNASIVIDSEEETIDEVASNIPEKEDVRHRPFADNCIKCTRDTGTQTAKIDTLDSEPSGKNQSSNSHDDVSALERKTRFMERLRGAKSMKGSVISKNAYLYLIEQVKKAKSNDLSKLVIDKKRVHNYDVAMSDKTERLATPSGTDNSMKIYVHIEEVYDIIDGAHMDTNHGGVLRMLKVLRRKYQNITRDMIRMYLETCTVCQKKIDMGSRCMIDMIDMQDRQVDGYSWILVYHHHTKLLQLRPLRSKQVDEVAEKILDIFAIFGAPSVLHTSRSRRFTNYLVKEICKRWRQMKIISGKPTSKQANTVKVENMLAHWMKTHSGRKWTESLRFLQVEINTDKTGLNAHQATFGTPFSFGLRCSLNTRLHNVTTEKELESVLCDGDCDSETLSSEDSSEEISDESSSDTSTTEYELALMNSKHSVVRIKRTKSDDINTKKKPKLN